MGLKTRENPETGRLEVLANGQWVDFAAYREQQITAAYDNSIQFLRERLGEDAVTNDPSSPAPPASQQN